MAHEHTWLLKLLQFVVNTCGSVGVQKRGLHISVWRCWNVVVRSKLTKHHCLCAFLHAFLLFEHPSHVSSNIPCLTNLSPVATWLPLLLPGSNCFCCSTPRLADSEVLRGLNHSLPGFVVIVDSKPSAWNHTRDILGLIKHPRVSHWISRGWADESCKMICSWQTQRMTTTPRTV